jgi:tetratricopeptide (TPR) repeat protein
LDAVLPKVEFKPRLAYTFAMSRRAHLKPPFSSSRRVVAWCAGLACLVFLALVILSFTRLDPPVPESAFTNTSTVVQGGRGQREQSAATNLLKAMETDTSLSGADKVSALVNRGTAFLREGQPAEAAALYEAALKMNPDDEDVHFNLGIALAKLGRLEEARNAYEAALKIFPEYPEVHNNLGNLLVSQGKMAEGVEHFKTALKSAPESASAHNNLGSALARQGDLDQAMQHFVEATRLQTNYLEADFNLGNTYLNLGKANLAVEKFSQILRQHPEFKPAQAALQRAREQLARGR